MIMTAFRKPGPLTMVRGTKLVRTMAPSICRFGSSYTCTHLMGFDQQHCKVGIWRQPGPYNVIQQLLFC